jgi:hypothetical protein
MDRIIFGDNQFFGINHMSEDKAQALSERFKDLQAITQVLDIAYEAGIHAFMLNANDRAGEICDYLRNNASRYPQLHMYPSIPYPHKYANMISEKGIFGTLHEVLIADNTASGIAGMLLKGGASMLGGADMLKIMQLLIDIEMKIFRGLDVKVVFLQNIVTDMLLGFGAKEFFLGFCDYISGKYHAQPGFISMNQPKLVESLLEWGVENPIVCSSINKAGYFMNPDLESYERAIREQPFRPVAMSILASGAIPPREAVEYICLQENIQSIVFGASSRNHILETKRLIDEMTVEIGEGGGAEEEKSGKRPKSGNEYHQ